MPVAYLVAELPESLKGIERTCQSHDAPDHAYHGVGYANDVTGKTDGPNNAEICAVYSSKGSQLYIFRCGHYVQLYIKDVQSYK